MIQFMLILSFLLHIVAIAAIYQLFKQNKAFKHENASDIMELFETYLEEIKEENTRLQNELSARAPAYEIQPSDNDIGHNPVDSENNGEEQESITADDQPTHRQSVIDDQLEASLQARILHLHQKGLPEEEIAKKLNCGKTEVALTIKLHAKK